MKRKALIVLLVICGLLSMQSPIMAARTYYDNGTQFSEIYCPTSDVHHPSKTMNEPPTIHIDGKYLVSDVDPAMINGRTLMPFRAAGEAIGATVTWDGVSQSAIATKDEKTVIFTLHNNNYTINGKTHYADVAPTAINNRILLPLRAFAEAFDAKVTWNAYLYDVVIDTAATNAPMANIPTDVSIDAEKFIQKYYVHPDSADPYVGTWRHTTTYYTGENSSETDCYIFVSKVANGYRCVEVTIEDWSNWDSNIITLMRDEAFTYYDATEDIELFMVDYNQDITYYRGPARGWTLSYFHSYVLFGNDLLFTGSVDSFGQFISLEEITLYQKL